ncbi:MAG: hypothetical protein AAGI44_12500, partial [Pseudomonadota bacterium]
MGLTNKRTRLIIKGVLLFVLLWFGTLVYDVHMAEHLQSSANAVVPDDLDRAKTLNPRSYAVNNRLGRFFLSQGEASSATEAFLSSLAENPAQGVPLAHLASEAATRGDIEHADELARLASSFMPVAPYAQRDLALYWSARGDARRAISHLSIALTGAPELRNTFYPILLSLFETQQGQLLVTELAKEPPAWWFSFFLLLMRESTNADSLAALVQARQSSTTQGLSAGERNAYISRLRKDGNLSQAYLYWVNGLTVDDLGYLGFVYDGGFERPLSNDAGFGWVVRSQSDSGFLVQRNAHFGMNGASAVSIKFSGTRKPFRHLSQQLIL